MARASSNGSSTVTDGSDLNKVTSAATSEGGFLNKVKSFFGITTTPFEQGKRPEDHVLKVRRSELMDGWVGGKLRVVCISDTHEQHHKMKYTIPPGDVLIHGGDFSLGGKPEKVEEFLEWFQDIPGFRFKVIIAGNHDVSLDEDYCQWRKNRERFKLPINNPRTGGPLVPGLRRLFYAAVERDVYYLNNEELELVILDDKSSANPINWTVEKKVKFWGAPEQPWFHDWAFNERRGPQIAKVWDRIPADTDILVTHGPPLGRGDLCMHGGRAGCADLLLQIQERIRPKLHVFGHIHEDYSLQSDGVTWYCNAWSANLKYACNQAPWTMDVDIHSDNKKGLPPGNWSRETPDEDLARLKELSKEHPRMSNQMQWELKKGYATNNPALKL